MTTHKEEVASITSDMAAPFNPIEQKVNAAVAKTISDLQGFLPLAAWVLVRIDTVEVSAGGILLPENTKNRPVIGTVVATGPDASPKIRVGDRVLFGKYAGVELEMPDGQKLKEHRVLRDVECYGRWPAKA